MLFVRVPLTHDDIYMVDDKYSRNGKYVTVGPKTEVNNKVPSNNINSVIYGKDNRWSFYCKSVLSKDIIRFRGGFAIERCDLKTRIQVAYKWYCDNNLKLPRKIKKKITRLSWTKKAHTYYKKLTATVMIVHSWFGILKSGSHTTTCMKARSTPATV